MTMKTILNIFKALEFIIEHGESFLQYYDYDNEQNLYKIKSL